MTIKEAISFAVSQIDALDAELLLCHLIDKDKTWLFLNEQAELSDNQIQEFTRLINLRKQNGKPVAHITGKKEFYGRLFTVTPDTLIPRPETEDLATAALNLINSHGLSTIIDIGTGSGCLGITLKLESPQLLVTCTDISSAALAVANQNAQILGAEVLFIESDLLENVEFVSMDLLIANLPYIAENDPEVDPEVAKYEPTQALYSGKTGLAHYERLLTEIVTKPFDFKYAIFEFGHRQAADISELLANYPQFSYEICTDLARHDRYVIISNKTLSP